MLALCNSERNVEMSSVVIAAEMQPVIHPSISLRRDSLLYSRPFFCTISQAVLFIAVFWLSLSRPVSAGTESDSSAVYTIAVPQFSVLGDAKELQWIGESCAEGIVTNLLPEQGLRFVERQSLSTIINELKFQESGLVNEQNAVALGKLVGADYFLLGSASLLNRSVVLRGRLVNIETGMIIQSGEVQGPLEDLFRLQRELARSLAVKILGRSILDGQTNENDPLAVSYAVRSQLNRVKKLSEALPLFALDPARKRKAGEYAAALMQCDGIIERYPNIVIGYYYKALFSMHAEEFSEADAAIRLGVSIDPVNREMLLLRSMLFFHQQKYTEASILLKYLSMQYPRDARIWFGIAKVSARLQDQAAVIEALINALCAQPYIVQVDPMLQTTIEQVRTKLEFSRNEYHAAVSLFRTLWSAGDNITASDLSLTKSVKKAFPDLYVSYFIEGKIQASQGYRTAAAENYRRCLELFPVFPLVHRELAMMLMDAGDCALGKQHATLYLQTSQSVDDYQQMQQRIDRCK
jgi:TolB-like protein/Tfp pilus assembly protein PilF